MENFLFIAFFSVLAIYFFSAMNVYKGLYKKLKEEKEILQFEIEQLEKLKINYEHKIKGSISALETKHDNLEVARTDLQNLRIENTELKHKVDILQRRSDELYAQLNAIY